MANEFQQLVEQRFMEAAKEQAHLFQSMGAIVASTHGENFLKLMTTLAESFTEAAAFEDDEVQRLTMRGAVIAMKTLISQVIELADRDSEIGERDVKVPDMVPGYASVDEDEDLSV